MGLIDYFFYIAGIAAVSVIGFKLGKVFISYVFDNWTPFVRITISHTNKNGEKRSKSIWLDKRIPEDKELIDIMDSIKESQTNV